MNFYPWPEPSEILQLQADMLEESLFRENSKLHQARRSIIMNKNLDVVRQCDLLSLKVQILSMHPKRSSLLLKGSSLGPNVYQYISFHLLEMRIELISSSCKGTLKSCPTSSPVSIKINGKTPEAVKSVLQKRGFSFVTLIPNTGEVDEIFSADSHKQDLDFENILKDVAKPRILLGLIKEDGFVRLNNRSVIYLQVGNIYVIYSSNRIFYLFEQAKKKLQLIILDFDCFLIFF